MVSPHHARAYSTTINAKLVSNIGIGVATSVEVFGTKDIDGNVKNKGTTTAAEYTLNSPIDSTTNQFEINAKLLDKFKFAATNGKVTFVTSNKDVLAFTDAEHVINGTRDTLTKEVSLGAAQQTATVKIVGAGTATIKAYLANNDEVAAEITVKVNPVPLKTLSIKSTKLSDKVTNTTRLVNGLANYYEVNLSPSAAETGVSAEDLTATAVKGSELIDSITVVKGDDDTEKSLGLVKNTIYVKVVPKANGLKNKISFKVSCDAQKVTSPETTEIESTPQLVVNNIAITPFGTNAVMAGSEVKTEAILYNAQGENISQYGNVAGADSVTVTSGALVSSIATISKDYKYDTKDKKGYITVKGVAEGTATVYLTSGSKSGELSVTVVKAGALTTASLGSEVSLVNNDTLKIDNDKTRVKDGENYYTLVTPTFKDNYGHAMTLTADDFNTYFDFSNINKNTDNVKGLSKSDEDEQDVTLKLFEEDAAGNVSVATTTDAVKYIGISAKISDTVDTSLKDKALDATRTIRSISVPLTGTVDEKKITYATLRAVVKPDRQAATLKPTWNQTTANIIVGGKSYTASTLYDQYGQKMDIKDINKYIYAEVDDTVAGFEDGALVGKKAGTVTAKLYYDLIANKKIDDADPYYTVTVTVQDAKAIKSLTISDTVSGADNQKYSVTTGAFANGNDLTFTASAKDAAGNVVSVPDGTLTWTVEASTVKDYTDSTKPKPVDASSFTFRNHDWNTSCAVLESTNITEATRGTITVRCTNLANNLSVDKVVTINGAAKKAQANTYFLSKNVDGENSIPASAITAFDVTGDSAKDKVYLYAKDQYGNNIAADYSNIKAAITSDAAYASIRPVEGTSNAFVILSTVADKETTLNVQLNPGLNDKLLSIKLNLKKVSVFAGFTNKLTSLKVCGKATIDSDSSVITFPQGSSYNDGINIPFDYSIAGAKKVVVTVAVTGETPSDAKFNMGTVTNPTNLYYPANAVQNIELVSAGGENEYTLTYNITEVKPSGTNLTISISNDGLSNELKLTVRKIVVE